MKRRGPSICDGRAFLFCVRRSAALVGNLAAALGEVGEWARRYLDSRRDAGATYPSETLTFATAVLREPIHTMMR